MLFTFPEACRASIPYKHNNRQCKGLYTVYLPLYDIYVCICMYELNMCVNNYVLNYFLMICLNVLNTLGR